MDSKHKQFFILPFEENCHTLRINFPRMAKQRTIMTITNEDNHSSTRMKKEKRKKREPFSSHSSVLSQNPVAAEADEMTETRKTAMCRVDLMVILSDETLVVGTVLEPVPALVYMH